MPFARRRKFGGNKRSSYRRRSSRFKRFRRGVRRVGGRKRRFGRRRVSRRVRRVGRATRRYAYPSKSTRSSGNIGQNYLRINRVVETASLTTFPFTSAHSVGRICVAWWQGATGIAPRGVEVVVSSSSGTITVPATLQPAFSANPSDYTIAGYYSVSLGDVGEQLSDNYEQYAKYRIRSVTYSFTDTSAVPVHSSGVSSEGASIRNAVEACLVNTGKTGQYVMPFALADTANPASSVDNPWYQAINSPSHANNTMRRFIFCGKTRRMSMRTVPMEEYVTNDNTTSVAEQSYLAAANGYNPQDIMTQSNQGTPYAQGWVVKRRKFRWTNLWVRAYDSIGGAIVPVLRNNKRAHGVQIMIKNKTYTTENVPYFTVRCNMSVEFKDRQGQFFSSAMQNSGIGNFLFPYTYAGGNTL